MMHLDRFYLFPLPIKVEVFFGVGARKTQRKLTNRLANY